MGILKIFREIQIDDQIKESLKQREIKIEKIINNFRMLFLLFIASFDVVALIWLKKIKPDTSIELAVILFLAISIPFVIILQINLRKKKLKRWIKYFGVTFDLGLSFFYGFMLLFMMDFPLPISKHTFAVLVSICLIFFNTLSVLRSEKRIVVFSGVLSLIFNAAIYALLIIYVLDYFSFVIFFTSLIIVIMSLFNLWVSEHIVNFFVINSRLDSANKEILDQNEEIKQQNEEITAQRDEITAQRDIVQDQKERIEEIHLDLSESINYAKRIQSSILPESVSLEGYFDEAFVLFKPRDVVSGDFYWWSVIENQVIIAAADCTGHGVPGAFMSMLGVSYLREIVLKEYITHPGVILQKLRKEIINTLKQRGLEGEQKDGMDIALVSIDLKTKLCQFAGANNPLYIIKNLNLKNKGEKQIASENAVMHNDNYELFEIKADKMPIAIYEKMDRFTTHEIQLLIGDQLYMCSDGYADQFGGPKGKKFKYKPFKELLIENSMKPMDEQKEILENIFSSWKGNYDQVDDVLIMGIKI